MHEKGSLSLGLPGQSPVSEIGSSVFAHYLEFIRSIPVSA